MQAISYTHTHSLQNIHVVYTCAAEKKRLNTWDASKAGTECFCPSSAYGQVLGGGSNAPCESRHATGTCKVKSQVVTRFEQFEIWKMFLRASSQVVSHLTLITWCHIVSHGVTWCHMVSHGVTFCNVVSCGVTLHRAASRAKAIFKALASAPPWPVMASSCFVQLGRHQQIKSWSYTGFRVAKPRKFESFYFCFECWTARSSTNLSTGNVDNKSKVNQVLPSPGLSQT